MFAVKALVQPLPERVPELDHGPVAVQLVAALFEPQVRFDWPLYATDDGLAEIQAVGAGLFSEQEGAFTPPSVLLQPHVHVVELSELLTLVPGEQL